MNGNYSSSPRKESTTGRPDRDPLATQDGNRSIPTPRTSQGEERLIGPQLAGIDQLGDQLETPHDADGVRFAGGPQSTVAGDAAPTTIAGDDQAEAIFE
jgi:hypothetical protein